MGRSIWVSACALLLGACASAPADGEPFTLRFEPQACTFDLRGRSGVECGIIQVPENYSAVRGRWIPLNIVVLRAYAPQAEPAAMLDLEGGPGLAVTEVVDFYLTDGDAYRRDRDVVLVDMRGTGRSNPLRCTELEAYDDADPNAPMFPPALVARCAADLRSRADIAQYYTNNAAADLSNVIETLGYKRAALIGTSYGTTLAMAMMTADPLGRDFRIDAAILNGAAPNALMPPRVHAPSAQRALDLYLEECAQEAACHAAFPDLRGDLERVRARYQSADPPAAPSTFEIFMEKLRTRMYAPAPANRLPRIIHAAAGGDFSAFAADTRLGGGRIIVDGLYLSITCAESFPHFDLAAARAEAQRTLFGDYRLRVQRAACDAWPVAPQTPLQTETPHPGIPVLFVSGRLDPVTTHTWVDEAMRRFPTSRHLLIEDGGHGQDGIPGAYECMDAIALAFFAARNVGAVDASCIDDLTRPPFALE